VCLVSLSDGRIATATDRTRFVRLVGFRLPFRGIDVCELSEVKRQVSCLLTVLLEDIIRIQIWTLRGI
jgi:hypothetical protein